MRWLRKNLDIILVSLFIAFLGFGAPFFCWAVTQIGTNQVQDQAITNAKVAPGINAEKIGADTTVSNTEFKALDGVTGPIQNQLNSKATWKGTWSSATTYLVSDVAIDSGTSYICILGHTNFEPPNPTYWNIFASIGLDGAQGETGPPGVDGAKGDTGPQGPAGLDGAKGDTGPAGQDGAKGDTGPAGADGVKGDTGPAGADGAKGDTGIGLPSDAVQGDIAYFDTDQWKSLPAGDSGKFLKTQGAAANPIWDTPSGSGDMMKADYAPSDAHIVDTAFQLSITSSAAGDILYFDGAKWVRLAADAGKYLKSGALAPAWDTPAGSGDMTKAVYDLDDNGRVDSAEVVTDGTNYSTAAEVKDAVSKKHDAATAGPGISVNGQEITNTDTGSGAVATHESEYDHTNIPTDSQLTLWEATGADSANKVTGSGTAGKIPQFTATGAIGDTTFTDTAMRTRHLRFVIMDASTLTDTELCLIPKLATSITVTNLEVVCNTDPDTEIAGDILYADTSFIAKGSPTVINDFDTSAGVRSDSTITTPSVASGKCVYIKFDTTPIAAIKEISFDITYVIN